MILLYLLAGLVALLLLLLFLPLHIRIWWEEERKRVCFGVLFLRFPIYPRKKSEKKAKRGHNPAEKPAPPEPFSFAKLQEKLHRGAKLARAIVPQIRPLCQTIRVPFFELHLSVHAANPALTAIEYGGVCAAFGLLWKVIDELFVIPSPRIEIEQDYYGEKTVFSFRARLWSNLWSLLRVALPVLKQFAPHINPSKPVRKQGA